MGLHELVDGVQTLAVVCNQWGDTGKGKFSDLFAAEWADVIARGTGGNNAGHTVVVNGEEIIFHLIPAGISYDSLGKINVLGNGMVIDPKVLLNELEQLKERGITYNHLMISQDASVIMPWQVERDRRLSQSQSNHGIGSTGRGIGPCYADKISRFGIRMRDLLDRDILFGRVEKNLRLYLPEEFSNVEEVIETYLGYGRELKDLIRDTRNEIHQLRRQGKKILLEGAQGLLLSIEHGTYPNVTSSDCGLNGTASGAGLSARDVDLCLGIVKFPFMTRVGGGPFPTELGGEKSEEYCAAKGHTKKDELREYGIPFVEVDGHVKYNPHDWRIMAMIDKGDSFERGVGIRLAAGEYGATTGRPRRTGITDLIALRYAVEMNGPNLILTKSDCLNGVAKFELGTCYQLPSGSHTTNFDAGDEAFLRSVKPVARTYSGYDTRDIHSFSEMPAGFAKAIGDLQYVSGGIVRVISVGPEKEQTIFA
ncbi:adenylosuccinate synthetase [Candidatus Woesearchaeota archaeon]|nr:adenylosuccinate synthetase [Candidatus Woesearchaeota archaeon]